MQRIDILSKLITSKRKKEKKESHLIIVADFNKQVYKEKYDLKGGDFSLYRQA
ncbi:hypothetical protein [Chryseobacterium cucumeris]|uniref:hypothetical protein n=1 Tax=Chryseobacterium cucumeris TaxID=1813611 RepID=UPI000B164BB6|nr:hypothetical protein [Chryseobacterium cucumeris]